MSGNVPIPWGTSYKKNLKKIIRHKSDNKEEITSMLKGIITKLIFQMMWVVARVSEFQVKEQLLSHDFQSPKNMLVSKLTHRSWAQTAAKPTSYSNIVRPAAGLKSPQTLRVGQSPQRLMWGKLLSLQPGCCHHPDRPGRIMLHWYFDDACGSWQWLHWKCSRWLPSKR